MAVDAEVMQALEDGGAVLSGHFRLNSGRHSDRYLEKFNILQWPKYTELVCRKMAGAASALSPRTIAGPTTGGVILSYEIGRQLGLRGIFAERDPEGGRSFQRDFRLEPGEPVMVVDDVMTSGESVFDTIEAVRKGGGVVVGVAVMVDRSGGKVDFGEIPFFAATEVQMQTWTAEECPLCQQGVPLKIT